MNKSFNKILAGCAAMAAMLFVAGCYNAENEQMQAMIEVEITLHGEPVALETPALLVDDVLMLPADDIFPALGLELLFPGSQHVAMARSDIISIDMTVGSEIMVVNDFPVRMAAVPVVLGGRLYVSECAVKHGVGAAVEWDEDMTAADIERQLFALRFWVEEAHTNISVRDWVEDVFLAGEVEVQNVSGETIEVEFSILFVGDFTGWIPDPQFFGHNRAEIEPNYQVIANGESLRNGMSRRMFGPMSRFPYGHPEWHPVIVPGRHVLTALFLPHLITRSQDGKVQSRSSSYLVRSNAVNVNVWE